MSTSIPAGVRSRRRIPSSTYKMVIFTAVTALLLGLLATLIGNISFTSNRTFYATFTDVTGVSPGDRVRLSGVEVGSVSGIELADAANGRELARVEFTVRDGIPLYRDARLEMRFENIVGQRYLAIEESVGVIEEMPEGETFPVEQTAPALNLTQLFNGFQPLLRALDPAEVNRIGFELVRAFQGEASSFQKLLADTASLTNHLADRDQVIGAVVDNLNAVLGTVSTRDQELTSLIVEFRNLMTGLAQDRGVIDAGLPDLAALLDGTSGFISAVRDPLRDDIAGLGEVARGLAVHRKELQTSLDRLPRKLRFMVRSGSYGSYFNFYVCGAEVRLRMLGTDTYLGTPGLGSNESGTVCNKADGP